MNQHFGPIIFAALLREFGFKVPILARTGGEVVDGDLRLNAAKRLGMTEVPVILCDEMSDAQVKAFRLPTTIGCSWGWTPADPSTLDPYFQKMAAQGQTFFVASGDSSTWSRGNSAWPADDANIISVGGTDLITNGAGGAWSSETAWVDSGGGISPDNIAIPSWQQLSGVIDASNRGSATLRNGPDVSANANFTFYVCANQTTCTSNEYGGTSFAAPMWAGYLALVNQQLAANNAAPIGFLNPLIYEQNVTPSYDANFHDISNGLSGSYSAVFGYDLVTGWGSPNAGLISALTTADFSLSASPASVSVSPGSTGTSTITSTIGGGFKTAVALSASGEPAGVAIGFTPTSITGNGGSTMTFTVASGIATGTYPITVTGAAGSATETTTIVLTIIAAPPGYAISLTATSLTIARNGSGTDTITTAVTGGFNSAIALSASGEGSGVTVTFSPTSIIGAGSSTMTVTANHKAATGNHTITVTGTSGGKTQTTTVTVNVT